MRVSCSLHFHFVYTSDEIVPLILNSTLNTLMDIHLVCLHGQLESIMDADIDDVATLFSGTVMIALLVDTN
jgi:hypothetical protein